MKKLLYQLDTKECEEIRLLYSKPLGELRKPKFKIGDRVSISKYDLPFRKSYKPQFIEEVFAIVAISSRKLPTYTIEGEQDEIFRGKFYQKELIKVILTMESFPIEMVSNASAPLFPDNTLSSSTNFLPEQLSLEGQWEVAISEIYYPSRYQIVTEKKFMYFDKKFSNSSDLYYLEPGLYPSLRILLKP